MLEKNRLGMLLFITSEATFFAMLITGYIYFRIFDASKGGPTAAGSLDPETTGLFSLFLFASSFTVWRAGKSLTRQNPFRLGMWLLATIVLGATFLFGQGLEWLHLMRHGVAVSRNLFGTTFFTLTGFHGLHVLMGLVALGILLGLTWAGDFSGPHSPAVESISLYWHFVDLVWVVIFSVVYLAVLF